MSPRWRMTSRLLQEQRSPGSYSGRKDWMVGILPPNKVFTALCTSRFGSEKCGSWPVCHGTAWKHQETASSHWGGGMTSVAVGNIPDLRVLFREKLRPTFFWLPSQLRFTLAMVLSPARYGSWKLNLQKYDYSCLAGRPDGKDWQESNSVCQPFPTADGLGGGKLQNQTFFRYTPVSNWVPGGWQGDSGPGGKSAGGAGPACLCYQGSLLNP